MRVSRQNAALVESLLQGEAVLALTLTDDADDPVLEPGVGETPLWPSVCVTALFAGDSEIGPLSQKLSLIPGIDRPQQVSFRKFEDRQWQREWLDRFKPMQFGSNLWIVPGEQEIPTGDGDGDGAGAVDVLRLDPGLAFGTGTHPTTRLCLQWIDSYDFKARTVVDYGCGSGVLGIAAAIKGAEIVVCVDNDPQALVATMENAIRNGVADRIQVMSPEEYEALSADVVLANILAGPLIELAPLLVASLGKHASLVMSGVLDEQADEVTAAYEPVLQGITRVTDDGWVRLHGNRRLT